MKNKRAGRPELYPGQETVLVRVLILKKEEKEMKAEIKSVQNKYKMLYP